MTREEFEQIPQLDKELIGKKDRLERLRSKASCMGPRVGEFVQSSPSSPGNAYLELAADLSKDVLSDEKKLRELKDEARRLISTLDGVDKEVLTQRYVQCLSWDEVASCMNYHVRWLHKLAQKAIEKLFITK